MIAIIDYGAGNLRSVQNALERIGAPHLVTSDPAEITSAGGVILPGVGAFGHAMGEINKRDMAQAIKKAARSGRPFLGICVGMQLFFEESEENPGVPGLGLMRGRVARFPAESGLKIPHIGWNTIKTTRPSRLLGGLPENPFMYFVHSYCVTADDREDVSATAEYGIVFDAAVEDGLLMGVQFHPEKSGEPGHSVLRQFVAMSGSPV